MYLVVVVWEQYPVMKHQHSYYDTTHKEKVFQYNMCNLAFYYILDEETFYFLCIYAPHDVNEGYIGFKRA